MIRSVARPPILPIKITSLPALPVLVSRPLTKAGPIRLSHIKALSRAWKISPEALAGFRHTILVDMQNRVS